MGLSETTASGDRRASLEGLRQVLALAIDNDPPARDLAALANRLQDVMAELDALPATEQEADVLDDIAARRAARGSSTG